MLKKYSVMQESIDYCGKELLIFQLTKLGQLAMCNNTHEIVYNAYTQNYHIMGFFCFFYL